MTIRVVIVDDHLVVREGMKALLSDTAAIGVVGEGWSVESALAAVRSQRPEVLITDIKLGDGSGVDVCRRAKAWLPGLRVIVLSAFWSDSLVREAFDAEADGYLLKSTESFDLAEAVLAVARGEPVVAPALAAALFRSNSAARSGGARTPKLTARERELLELVALGLTNQEIAVRMFLSPHTVKDYLSSVLAKFGAANRTELTLLATRSGSIDPVALRESTNPPFGGSEPPS